MEERKANSSGVAIVLSEGQAVGDAVQIVEVPKDSSKSHPNRQKEVIQKVNAAVPGLAINQHDIQCAIKAYGVRRRPEYFYQGKVKGRVSHTARHLWIGCYSSIREMGSSWQRLGRSQ